MQSHQIFYLQQMGYTIWRHRKEDKSVSCQCVIADHSLDQATLICCLNAVPDKSEKDLWTFLAMSFDIGQHYYIDRDYETSEQNSVCLSCLQSWLKQSRHHYAMLFGHYDLEYTGDHHIQSIVLPSLSDMLRKPLLKKQCFKDINHFLCQHHITI